MRKIIKTQTVQWKSNAEFAVINELKNKDWDVIISIVHYGDYQNIKTFTCKDLKEANSLLLKGDEIVKYEFRIWEDDKINTYNIQTKEISYKSYAIRANSEDEAKQKISKSDITTEIEIISVTKL